MLSLQARVDQGAIAVKEYSAFPKAPASLEPYYKIAFWVTNGTLNKEWGSYPSAGTHLVYFAASADWLVICT